MVHSSRSWPGTGPDGNVAILTYVQTDVGNFAYRQRENITDTRTAIAANLSNAEVDALFAD